MAFLSRLFHKLLNVSPVKNQPWRNVIYFHVFCLISVQHHILLKAEVLTSERRSTRCIFCKRKFLPFHEVKAKNKRKEHSTLECMYSMSHGFKSIYFWFQLNFANLKGFKMSETALEKHEEQGPAEMEGKAKLRKWLNMNLRIEMTDGRVLIGVFLCTDRDANVILGACSEYLATTASDNEEPRVLGLVMVPGRHIVSIHKDDTTPPQKYYYED